MSATALLALIPALSAQTASTPHPPAFADRSAALGIEPAGQHAAWCDANADGWPDLRTSGALWLNRAGKSFTRIDAPGEGLVADIDNDGVGDLVSFAPIAVARGVRDGDSLRFEPLALPELPKTVSRGVAVGDFDGDGFRVASTTSDHRTVRRDAGGVDPGSGAASSFHIHDPKDAATVLSISPRIVEATLPHRASMRE
jgi:hypothetical protein